ncbi:Uu.00g088310.m01.CDS01 [Anthostomella pinea]|uniref:Uu.00g088310.m01.CDS01 n=1 Tax=Anthostomella pinea TaxID=933095 RepID=A0AAI8VNN5_9PEZI|nr:Uu.00g088310.m01.CDS01 [Anthostomella pinea]
MASHPKKPDTAVSHPQEAKKRDREEGSTEHDQQIIKKLKQELQDARTELTDVHDELKEARDLNERNIKARRSFENSDTELRRQFFDLRTSIREFTKARCGESIQIKVPSLLSKETEGALGRVSGIPFRRLLQSQIHSRLFIEAVMWRILCDTILDNPFVIWGSEKKFGESIAAIQKGELGGSAECRNFWRACTATLIYETAPNKTRMRRILRFLFTRIEPFVLEEHKAAKAEVYKIVDEAVELARNLASSESQYDMRRKEPQTLDTDSQPFNETWMEILEKSASNYDDIDFLISPALVQCGNVKGTDMERVYVKVKAEVCYRKGRHMLEDQALTEDDPLKPPVVQNPFADAIVPKEERKDIASRKKDKDIADEAKLLEAIGDDPGEESERRQHWLRG